MTAIRSLNDLSAVNGGSQDFASAVRMKIGGIIAECPACKASVFHTIYKLENSSLMQVCNVCQKETKL